MPTDWTLIRRVAAAAIDACEAAERLGLTEADRALVVARGGQPVSVFDVATSAWTYPESLRHAVVRARHDLGDDAAYVHEHARVLRAVGELCAELVGASRLDETAPGGGGSIRTRVEALAAWYEERMTPVLAEAAAGRSGTG